MLPETPIFFKPYYSGYFSLLCTLVFLIFWNEVDQVLRNRADDERLSDLATLAVHKQLTIYRKKVIDVIADRLDRRFQFLQAWSLLHSALYGEYF
jgi:hypothetical protein